MTETVGVVIPVFGDDPIWKEYAERAFASVDAQTVPTECIRTKGKDLTEARNHGAIYFDTDWLIFLDADDELDPHYIEHMLAGKGDIRQPSTLGVYEDGSEDEFPVLIPPKPSMLVGNHLIIGSMVRRQLFMEVGGFMDLPILEDWDLWIRLWLNGADIQACPEAIYRVHVRPQSRNTDQQLHNHIYSQIQSRYIAAAAQRGRS